jgi:hypothetical protein
MWQVLRDTLAEQTPVWNSVTMIDDDKLDGSGRAVAKHISGCGMTVSDRSQCTLG